MQYDMNMAFKLIHARSDDMQLKIMNQSMIVTDKFNPFHTRIRCGENVRNLIIGDNVTKNFITKITVDELNL